MPLEVQLIPLDKITPIFNANISEAYKKRMNKTSSNLLDYDLFLAVERNQIDDGYYLLGGYDRYHYLLDCTDSKVAPCIIEDSTTQEEKLLKIIRRLYPSGDNNKNKERILVMLEELGVDMRRVVDQTPITMNELKRKYHYSPSIPTEFINENTIPIILNEIELLKVSPEAKSFLFASAGLPKGDPNRLTGQVMSIIKSHIKKDERMKYLTPAQQIRTLKDAFNPKKTILEKLRETVDRFIFRKAS